MSHFDMFFYKLKSQHRFQLNEIQFFEDTDNTAGGLRAAVQDIRMYLNKYPYDINQYQIIFTMRTAFAGEATDYRGSLLHRLMQISYELRNARIFLQSQEQKQKAVNFIMLYDADFSASLPKLDNFLHSERLTAQALLLLHKFGLSADALDENHIEKQLEAYRQNVSREDELTDFFESLLHLLQNRAVVEDEELSKEDEKQLHFNSFLQFLRSYLGNFNVFEKMIDKNDRRSHNLSFLRIVEFINMEIDHSPLQGGSMRLLTQICQDNWETVWQDDVLEQRYAQMLRNYQQRLRSASNQMENYSESENKRKTVPATDIPKDNMLTAKKYKCIRSELEEGAATGGNNNILALIRGFIPRNVPRKQLMDHWNSLYRKMNSIVDNLDEALEAGAQELSESYTGILEDRKKETLPWKKEVYFCGSVAKKYARAVGEKRAELMEELKKPGLTPSLKFQDQLNMETALKQEDRNIRYYIKCIEHIKWIRFLLLIACVLGITLLHYGFLQSFVFSNATYLLIFIGYFAALAVAMLLAWKAPYIFFIKKIEKSLFHLEEQVKRFINGYLKKAQAFERYINIINQLDYITKYEQLLQRADYYTGMQEKGFLWHKNQIELHLKKLEYFNGLIQTFREDSVFEQQEDGDISELFSDEIHTVAELRLYWPQC